MENTSTSRSTDFRRQKTITSKTPLTLYGRGFCASDRTPTTVPVRRPGPSQIKMYGFCRLFRAMRTLQALRDAANPVLAFPFEIFEEGPSKAKVHTCMATESKQIPGFVMASVAFPLFVVSSCFHRLYGRPACIWRVASNGRFFFERLQPETVRASRSR